LFDHREAELVALLGDRCFAARVASWLLSAAIALAFATMESASAFQPSTAAWRFGDPAQSGLCCVVWVVARVTDTRWPSFLWCYPRRSDDMTNGCVSIPWVALLLSSCGGKVVVDEPASGSDCVAACARSSPAVSTIS
jgi:hypothetical protein